MQKTKNPLIFIVDDNIVYKDIIVGYLKQKNFKNIRAFTSAEECLKEMHSKPDIVILDYLFQDTNGIEILRKVQKEYPQTDVIFLSGQNDVEVAVNIMKLGVSDYIIKNEKAPEHLVNSIEHLVKSVKRTKIRKGFQIGVFGFFAILFLIILILILMSIFIKDFKI